MFPFGYSPIGWIACNGQQVSLAQNQALYSLLGSRFGGDSRTYFNMPNLNGRIPLSSGTAQTGTVYAFGATLGQETVTLTNSTAPAHRHGFSARLSGSGTTGMTGTATATGAAGNSLLSRGLTSAAKTINAYDVPPISNDTTLGLQVSPAYGNAQGGTDPHPNIQPYLVMAYYICNDGTYPPRPD
ncbi:tail fiber protein [Sphingomonas sp. HF-S3]|uniref:Tail fiber protein n=1 Tax=Sphingomonas rustica TaxID=3103142 RepID=A0ABV0B583_9SPHN